MSMPTIWTPQKEQALKRMWEDGQSAAAISDVIKCSRSAILGKVRRMGLKLHPTTGKLGDERFWALPEDKLRTAIARRASQGARKARLASS